MIGPSLRKTDLSDSCKDLWEQVRKRGLMAWPVDSPSFQGTRPSLNNLLTGGPATIDHPFFEMKVFIDGSIGEKLVNLIASGDYELMDLDLFDLYINPGDRVVDIGAGVGIAGAFCGMKAERSVVVVEPNVVLHKMIVEQGRINQVELIPLHAAVVADSRANGSIEFHFHDEFWRSTANPSDGEYRRVEHVRTMGLNELLTAHPADILVVDVEGAEVGLFDEPLTVKPKRIFIEIHIPNIGEKAAAAVVNSISAQGYRMIDFRAWMFAFECHTSHGQIR